METNLHTGELVRYAMPAHSFHPNASLRASSKTCYIAYPRMLKAEKRNDLQKS